MAAAVALPLSVSLVIFIDCEDAFALGCWCLHSPIKPYARPPIMSRRTAAVIRTPGLCRLISPRMYSALEVEGAVAACMPAFSLAAFTVAACALCLISGDVLR